MDFLSSFHCLKPCGQWNIVLSNMNIKLFRNYKINNGNHCKWHNFNLMPMLKYGNWILYLFCLFFHHTIFFCSILACCRIIFVVGWDEFGTMAAWIVASLSISFPTAAKSKPFCSSHVLVQILLIKQLKSFLLHEGFLHQHFWLLFWIIFRLSRHFSLLFKLFCLFFWPFCQVKSLV